MQSLEILHRLLGGDQLRGESLCSVLVLGRLLRVPPGPRLVGERESLLGVGLQLLDRGELTVQLHLDLTLVADHRRGLFGQLPVLILGLLDRLLDLHLRVSVLLDLRVEQGHEVLPALGERVSHGVQRLLRGGSHLR